MRHVIFKVLFHEIANYLINNVMVADYSMKVMRSNANLYALSLYVITLIKHTHLSAVSHEAVRIFICI